MALAVSMEELALKSGNSKGSVLAKVLGIFIGIFRLLRGSLFQRKFVSDHFSIFMMKLGVNT